MVTQGGDRIVISVPGQDGDAAKQLGQTAQLRFRPVMASGTAGADLGRHRDPARRAPPRPAPRRPSRPGRPTAAAPSGSAAGRRAGPPGRRRAGAEPPRPPPPPASADAGRPGHPAGRRRPGAVPAGRRGVPGADLRRKQPAGAATDKPTDVIAACDQDGTAKYLLDPAIIEGTQIGGASVVAPDTTNAQWRVSLDFKGARPGDLGASTPRSTTSR